jgi:hypothetical protein
MKSINKILAIAFIFSILISPQIIGQEDEAPEFRPAYIVITKMHWNSDDAVDFSEWKKTEEEYFNKVTNKNDLILHSGVYRHYLTPDSSEILFITVYDSWMDFEMALDVNALLIEEGWPDEDERAAFLDTQSNFYEEKHSDEMFSTLPFHKDLVTDSKKPLLIYMRKNEVGREGSGYTEYFENVIAKNNYIKGFFTMKHLFGADSNDAYEIGVYDNLADIESAFDENTRLTELHWPDVEKREVFFKELSKIFNGHGDYIYITVPELAK